MENTKRKLIVVFLIVVFAVFNVYSFSVNDVKAETEAEKVQKEYDKSAKELKEAYADLAVEQSKLYKNQTQISATTARINKIKADMAGKEAELKNLSAQAELNKKLLGEYIRQIYYADQDNDPLVELALFNGNLSDMVSDSDSMLSIKEKINDALKIINNAKIETEEAKEELADQQSDHQKLLNSQKVQQNEINEDIQETQATISELQKKMAELKSSLNRILGKSYSAENIKEAIKIASKKTGVREGFLFGMLSMESGGNPLAGRCTYKNCDMNSNRKKKFKEVCGYLGYDTKKCESMPLSCASKSYKGSGGAMGAAQFMSDTWMGYKNRIANAINDSKPNPWELLDGVVAMALYLDDLGATNSGKVSIKNPCNGKSVKVKWEIYASMRYLGWTCYGYTNYAPGVQSLANGYKNL